jgi:hypothetical protein
MPVGWPSFPQPALNAAVEEASDAGMDRDVDPATDVETEAVVDETAECSSGVGAPPSAIFIALWASILLGSNNIDIEKDKILRCAIIDHHTIYQLSLICPLDLYKRPRRVALCPRFRVVGYILDGLGRHCQLNVRHCGVTRYSLSQPCIGDESHATSGA